jgi:RecA/RadA recombinase
MPGTDYETTAAPGTNGAGLTEPKPEPPTIAEVVTELAGAETLIRLPTGIPTLDECMRGGLPSRRLVVLGGAPGAGKTSLVSRLAYQWALQKVHVGMLCADEGPEGIVDRASLYESCRRDLLEAKDEHEWARFVTAVRDLPLILDAGDLTIEAMAAHLRSKAGKAPAVLVIDSIQTVRAEMEAGDRADRRSEIDRVVRALKYVVAKHHLLVVATCELARAFYRSSALAAQLNPLAAFKESGSIEYAAQTAIVLTTPKGQADVIDATVCKNRGYRKKPFRLALHADLTFHETEAPAEEERDEEAARVADQAELDRDVQEVSKALVEGPGVAGSHALRAAIRARGHRMGQSRVDAAVARLGVLNPGDEDTGQRIVNRGHRQRPRWHLRTDAEVSQPVRGTHP